MRLGVLAACISLATILAACGPGGTPGNGQGHGEMPPAVVSVQEAKPRDIPATFEYPARIAGSREVEVRARVAGILLERNFEEGAAVRQGQSLFSLDAAPYEAALARAEAELGAAEARHAQAKRNAARAKPLFEAKAASRKDFDDAVSAEEVAAADVKAAKARLAEARLALAYTRVESPVAGLTSRALKSEGTLVSGPDVLLTTVTRIDPVHVNFGLSEAEQARLRQEAAAGRLLLPKDGRFEVAVRFEDGRTYSRTGRLAYTDVRVDNATGTSDARAELANPAGDLRPGQFVRVILKGATRPAAITVPQRAVMEGPQGKLVYVVGPDSKAVPKPIQVGDWAGDAWIVTSGVAPGDRVIVDGLMKVYPGAPVQVAASPGGQPGAGAATPAKAEIQPPESSRK